MGAVERPETSPPAGLEEVARRAAENGDTEKGQAIALLAVSASLERVAYALGQLTDR